MKISLGMFESTILLIAELFFNNNSTKTVATILDASFTKDNTLTFNNRPITIPELKSHAERCAKWDFEKYMGSQSTLKPEFTTNFYLLSPEVQEALIEILYKVKNKHQYSYGTVKNLSAYTPPDANGMCKLDFYINVSNAVGKSSAHDFIGTLHTYNSRLKTPNSKLPNSSVLISRWEHLKNRFCQPLQDSLYSEMLVILGYPADVDCFQADLDDLNLILKNI